MMRRLALTTTALITLAACAGESDTAGSSSNTVTEPDATSAPVATELAATTPPQTEPPATDPPITDPPVTEPAAAEPAPAEFTTVAALVAGGLDPHHTVRTTQGRAAQVYAELPVCTVDGARAGLGIKDVEAVCVTSDDEVLGVVHVHL